GLHMIHQVVPQFAAGVGQASRKFGRGGVQQNTNRFQGGGTEEDYFRAKFNGVPAARINHAHAAGFSRFGIENDAVHYAERTQRHAASLPGGRQGRVHAAEIGKRDASSFTRTAVVAGGASFVGLRKYG